MSDRIYDAIFTIAAVLELPVVILALLSSAVLVVELGAFLVEVSRRRRRGFHTLAAAADESRRAVDAGERDKALDALACVARSTAMRRTLRLFVEYAGSAGADVRIAKQLADFDFDRQRRLGRTRLLVRTGPALGLMGTLIPLSPALDGLARGNVAALTTNLRVAFSVTVLGILIGAVAFGISLVRDRIYGQDFSDLQYVAAVLTDDRQAAGPSPTTAREAR